MQFDHFRINICVPGLQKKNREEKTWTKIGHESFYEIQQLRTNSGVNLL